MTIRQAEKICRGEFRYETVQERGPRGGVTWRCTVYWSEKNGGRMVGSRTSHREADAIKACADQIVYKIFQMRAYERAGYKCEECGAIGVGLETDHIIPRSRGRLDVDSNLKALCNPCHRRKHGDRIR